MPKPPPNRDAIAYGRMADTFQEWIDDPDGKRGRREEEEVLRELAKHLPPEAIVPPPPRTRPEPLTPADIEHLRSMVRFYRALSKDDPPEGKGMLLGLVAKYIEDPDDPRVCRYFEGLYPEIYEDFRAYAQRQAAATPVAVNDAG